MEKKLPGVFASKIEKKINNNESVHYTNSDEKNDIKKSEVKEEINNKINKIDVPKKSIKEKINDIFSSTAYIYKADVEIKTKDKTITKRIIGRNNHNLITIDNELIPIDKIEDIKFIKE